MVTTDPSTLWAALSESYGNYKQSIIISVSADFLLSAAVTQHRRVTDSQTSGLVSSGEVTEKPNTLHSMTQSLTPVPDKTRPHVFLRDHFHRVRRVMGKNVTLPVTYEALMGTGFMFFQSQFNFMRTLRA